MGDGFSFPSRTVTGPGGEANDGQNVGTGEGTLVKGKSGVFIQVKSLKEGANVTLTNNADDVTIACDGAGVQSVNSQTGAVVLDTDDISEGAANKYYDDALVSANSDVAANTAARHTHANKAVIDAISAAGSGSIITAGERALLPTSNQKDAMDNASAPTAGNPFATIADVPGAGVKTYVNEVGDYNALLGHYRTRSIAGTGSHHFNFSVPADFGSLVELYLVGSPLATFAAQDIDLNSSYGSVGESTTQHTEVDTVSTFSMTSGQWNKLDLSSVFSSLAVGDHCGVQIDHNAIGTTVHYKAVVMRYNPA